VRARGAKPARRWRGRAPADGTRLSWDPKRETLLCQHADTVRRFCHSRISNESDAEDAAQDTFLRFLICKDEVRNPEAWLVNAARCVCADFHRKLSRQRTTPLENEIYASAGADPADVVVELHTAEQLLDRLLAPDRDLLGKLYLRGLSVQQVAALMKVSPGNVRIMSMRARRRASEVFASMGDLVGGFALVDIAVERGRTISNVLRSRVRALGHRIGRIGPAGSAQLDVAWWSSAAQLLAPAAILALLLGSAPVAPPSAGAVASVDRASSGSEATSSAATRGAGAGARGIANFVSGPATPPVNGGWRGSSDPSVLAANIVAPGRNAKQEDATFSSMTLSPGYRNDHTVFASGMLVYGCGSTCNTVFVTHDGARNWQHLAAANFGGGRILLPPTYPQDATLFAVGALGLQRSDDGGLSWSVVIPGVTAAAMAPDSAAGNARLLLATQTLMWYRAAKSDLAPGPLLPATMTGVYDLAFGGGGKSVTVLGQEMGVGVVRGHGLTIARCELATTCSTVAGYGDLGASVLRVSPTIDQDGTMLMYSGTALAISSDDGRSFRRTQLPDASHISSVSFDPAYAANRFMLIGAINIAGGTARSEIAYSRDGGNNIAWLGSRGVDPRLALAVVQVLADGHLLAAWSNADATGDLGIRCSTDGGSTWNVAC
jgi:RNA polymerase sigma-70 factor (ECF subfamily)